MKPPFRNQANADTLPKDYEVNTMPSETVPDQTLSLKQLLDRYARGIPIEGERFPLYNEGDPDLPEFLPDFNKMDLSEIADYKEHLEETIKQQQAKIMEERHIADSIQNEKNMREQFKKWKEDEEDIQLEAAPKSGKKN